jgi:nickel-dependent lactate racemase
MIQLPYGKGYQTLNIADDRITAVLTSQSHEYKAMKTEEQLVQEALEKPIASARLCEMVKDANHVLVITSDHTRPVPSKVTLPLLLKEIRKKNPDIAIKILIATGCHRPTSQKEMIEKFGEQMVAENEFMNHDSRDDSRLVYKGQLPSGGELWVNQLVDWADLIVSEGFIEPHFFAGFSGGRKSILPGIASFVTVHANHCAEFIASPKAKTGNLMDNPIQKDMLYAMRKVGLAFILNVVIDKDKKVINAFAGDPDKAHEIGCAFVTEQAGVKAVKADIVITSNGGYPLDQNIYQSVKSMTAAARCVTDNGVIITLSACSDGHGGKAFYDYFAKAKSAQDVVKTIQGVPRNQTKTDQWQAQILANVLTQNPVIMVADSSQKEAITNMKMLYAKTVDEALAQAEAIVGSKARITVIPNGVDVIVEE